MMHHRPDHPEARVPEHLPPIAPRGPHPGSHLLGGRVSTPKHYVVRGAGERQKTLFDPLMVRYIIF